MPVHLLHRQSQFFRVIRPPPFTIHFQRHVALGIEGSEARPTIVPGRLRDSSFHRIGMNVIDLLPNHPTAPQRQGLEAFLPNLMTICIGVKSKSLAVSHNAFSRKTLERTYELLNSTIAWINYY